MKRHTRSILEELNSMSAQVDQKHIIENQADNVIASASNLVNLIRETYDDEVSNDLIKRLINSIKAHDPSKFKRGIRKVNESKRHSGREQ